MAKHRKGNKPARRSAEPIPADGGRAPEPGYPLLCLRHLQSGWGFDEASADQCQQFLVKWAKRAALAWTELVQHGRHGLGSEKIPRKQIKPDVPEHLQVEDHYLVFRHEGNLPFVGFRSGQHR